MSWFDVVWFSYPVRFYVVWLLIASFSFCLWHASAVLNNPNFIIAEEEKIFDDSENQEEK